MMILLSLPLLWLIIWEISRLCSAIGDRLRIGRYMNDGIEILVSELRITESDGEQELRAVYNCWGVTTEGRYDSVIPLSEEQMRDIAENPNNYTFLAYPKDRELFMVEELLEEGGKKSTRSAFVAAIMVLLEIILILFVGAVIAFVAFGMLLGAAIDGFFDFLGEFG